MTRRTERRVMWSPEPDQAAPRGLTPSRTCSTLPDDAPRVELRDGVLMPVVPSRRSPTRRVGDLLVAVAAPARSAGFSSRAPPSGSSSACGTPSSRTSLVLRRARSRRAPLHRSRPGRRRRRGRHRPARKRRDRLEKPNEYAAAGIPHFWRIEQDPLHVYAYDLVDGAYQLVADSADELVLSRAVRDPAADPGHHSVTEAWGPDDDEPRRHARPGPGPRAREDQSASRGGAAARRTASTSSTPSTTRSASSTS